MPWIAAFAQTAQYALAGSILIGPKGWFFGGLLGGLVSMSQAYGASQYADIAAKRKPYVMAGMALVMTFSPAVVGTSVYIDIIAAHPWINPVWSGIIGAVWGVIPDLSVLIVGFTAGKGMVSEVNHAATSQAATTSEDKPVKSAKAAKPAKDERIPCPHKGAGCGITYAVSDYKDRKAAQNATNAHARRCAYKPIAVMVEP